MIVRKQLIVWFGSILQFPPHLLGLGVPEYNGGLFDPEEHPFLEEHAIADAHLVPVIQQLAQVYDKELKRVVAVDYNTLSERHLGSIYEGLLEFKPLTAPYDLVFSDINGRPIDPSTLTHNFGRIVKRAGLNARFHDLRHSYASLMLASGVHPKIVSEALGHSTVAITLDICSHVTPGL